MSKEIWVRADRSDNKEDRKETVISALESGVDVALVRAEDSDFAEFGKVTLHVAGKDVELVELRTPEDQDRAMAMAGKADAVVLDSKDWTVIPLENLIAKFRGTKTKVLACASNIEDAKLYTQTLEKGVDGIVIDVDDPEDIRKFAGAIGGAGKIDLQALEVLSVKNIEMGDRVCVDTCSNMVPGEGMLVGSYSNCLFLIQSESEENGYVAARPFRVNAGAVHEYCMVPGGGTRYLSEVSAGDSVLVCDRDGNTRTASVGRCKVEVRPLLMVEATDGRKKYNVVLQNAETIKVVTASGSKSVTTIVPGDRILAHLSTGGRHFGMAVEETITEK